MKVTVRFYGALYELTRAKECHLEVSEGATLMEVIKVIDRVLSPDFSRTVLDDKGALKSAYVVLINGSAVRSNNPADVRILENDVVAFLPPAVGGSVLCRSGGEK